MRHYFKQWHLAQRDVEAMRRLCSPRQLLAQLVSALGVAAPKDRIELISNQLELFPQGRQVAGHTGKVGVHVSVVGMRIPLQPVFESSLHADPGSFAGSEEV